MNILIIIILAAAEAAIFAGVMYSFLGRNRKRIRDSLNALQLELDDKSSHLEKIREVYAKLIPITDLKYKAREYFTLDDSLRAERGRITITQAELETVENRLRDLEEIERELLASNHETQEELNILKKKEKDLKTKNDQLKSQLDASQKQMEQLLGQLEMSAEMTEKLTTMQTELARTEEKVSGLLAQIEVCNEQYIALKMRYDALDIEYAQLYEKFADSEQIAKQEDQ